MVGVGAASRPHAMSRGIAAAISSSIIGVLRPRFIRTIVLLAMGVATIAIVNNLRDSR